MNKEFIPYEQALALKELGFDESCLNFYFRGEALIEMKATHTFKEDSECVKAPLYQQAFRWFREKYGLEGFVTPLFRAKLNISFEERKYDANIVNGTKRFHKKGFATHKEAELECLKKLIEIVKDGKK